MTALARARAAYYQWEGAPVKDLLDLMAAAIEAAVAEARTESILEAMKAMTDEQRLSIMSNFCNWCGGPAPCQCWNDE